MGLMSQANMTEFGFLVFAVFLVNVETKTITKNNNQSMALANANRLYRIYYLI